jgi:hypothetical protein
MNPDTQGTTNKINFQKNINQHLPLIYGDYFLWFNLRHICNNKNIESQ